MKARIPVLFLAFTFLISACGGTSPQPAAATNEPPGASANSPTRAASLAPPATQPAEPIQVSVLLEEAAAVEALIPLEGGELSVAAGDGTRFRLEIPADALVEPVNIRMTPVKTVEGLPFGSETHAVHLEPEGLVFFGNFATLTIEPAEEIPLDEQIFFGYQNEGADVFLAAPDVGSPAMKVLLSHFSGYGVTKGFLADTEPVRARLGGSDETRLQSQVAAVVTAERQRQEKGGGEGNLLAEEFSALIQEYYEKVVQPRIAAAGESCAAGRLAVDTAINFVRQVQLLGGDEDYPGIDLNQLLDTATMACLREEYELCAEQHIVHRMIPVWLAVERQDQLLGRGTDEAPSDSSKEALRLVQQCLSFELKFESKGKTMDALIGFDGGVSASVPLKFDPETISIHGTGTLVNEYSNFYAEDCTVDFTPTDGTFEVFSLSYDTNVGQVEARGEAGNPGKVTDVFMHYFPGATAGPFSLTCDGYTYSQGPGTTWFAVYLLSHQDEQGDSAERLTYLANDWNVLGGELFAERSWQRSDPSTETSEQGSMKLFHRPGG